MRSIFKTLGRALTQWWQADRIRVSSREGRLLRLQTGQRVLIHGRVWKVEASDLEELQPEKSSGTQASCLKVHLSNCDATDETQTALLEIVISSADQHHFVKPLGFLCTDSSGRVPVSDADIVPA